MIAFAQQHSIAILLLLVLAAIVVWIVSIARV